SAAPGAPNFPVIGFAPGFIESIFYGYANPNVYGKGTANSFTAKLQPLEDQRGRDTSYGITFSYRWAGPSIDLTAGAARKNLSGPTALTPGLGGSQNYVNIRADYLNLGLGWKVDDKLKLSTGLEYVGTHGHLDSAGLYNRYAVKIGSSTFDNLNSVQWVPN